MRKMQRGCFYQNDISVGLKDIIAFLKKIR
jgi:hypothetical protein